MLSINEDKSHTGTDFDDPGIYIWIRTYHPDCEGIWDPEQNQIDENVFCRTFTTESATAFHVSP